eukprot:364857-Chlamydomonas_euryale.AAC.14
MWALGRDWHMGMVPARAERSTEGTERSKMATEERRSRDVARAAQRLQAPPPQPPMPPHCSPQAASGALPPSLNALFLKLCTQLRQLRVERLQLLLGLRQVLLRQPQVLLGLSDLFALRLDGLGHVVVVDHGHDPLEQPRAGGRDALECVEVEVGVLEVVLDLLDLLLGQPILVELDERLEKAAVGHHGLGARPRHILEAAQDDDALTHALHLYVGLGKRPDLGDVVLAQVVERRRSLLQRRDGFLQRRLSLGLLDRDLRAVQLQLLLLALGRVRLGLHFGRGAGDDLKQRGAVSCRCLHHDLGLAQLFLHRVHLDRRLHQLVEPAAEPAGHLVDELAVGPEAALVVVDEVEVVLGRHVVVAAQLLQEARAERPHALMHHDHVLHNLRAHVARQRLARQEDRRD